MGRKVRGQEIIVHMYFHTVSILYVSFFLAIAFLHDCVYFLSDSYPLPLCAASGSLFVFFQFLCSLADA